MKRILSSFLLIFICFITLFNHSFTVFAAETLADKTELYAKSAVLMDADSGRILFEKEGKSILPMASTTKIMTCILALENGNKQDFVKVSDYAASMPDVQLHIRKGEQYQLKDLLYSLMLESHNDSAVAVAEHIGKSVEGFAKMMNDKAREIGCKNTFFITPNGLDAQKEIMTEDGSKKTLMHSTTAEDLALIMSYCIKKSPKKEEFLEITGTAEYHFSDRDGGRSFFCHNHNAFLNMMDGALSGKTGFTGKAGYCYVGALERDGKTFVVALLACGWPNHKTYKWSDTKKLMTYGIDNYEKVDVSKEKIRQEWLKRIAVSDADTKDFAEEAWVEVYRREKNPAPMILMRKDEKIQINCEVKKQLKAPVQKDQMVGTIQYLLNDRIVWEEKIYTKSSLKKKGFSWYFKKVLWKYAA